MGSHDGSVHHQPLVGVDTDTEETRIGVNLENLVTGSQAVEDTSPVEEKQRNYNSGWRRFWISRWTIGHVEHVGHVGHIFVLYYIVQDEDMGHAFLFLTCSGWTS